MPYFMNVYELYLYAKNRESLIKQVLSKTIERLKRKEQKSDFPALNAAIGRNKHFQKMTIMRYLMTHYEF